MKVKSVRVKVIVALFALVIVVASGSFVLGSQIGVPEEHYYLHTPLPLCEFYVGQYVNGSYFAVNGSNWRNFLVTDNATYLFVQVLGNASDGRVYVGAGVYSDVSLVIDSGNDNLTLEAESLGVVFSQSDDAKDVVTLDGVSGVTVSGFTIKGASGSVAGSQAGVYLHEARNCTVKDNFVYDIACDEGTDHAFAGIVLWDNCFGNVVVGNRVQDSTFIGITCASGSQYNIISGNTVVSSIDNCIDLNGDSGTNTSWNQVVHNTLINSTGREGIDLDDCDNNYIHGNLIIGCDTNGVAVAGSASSVADHNVIDGNFIDGLNVTEIGIAVGMGANGTKITNNKIMDIAGSTNKIGINVYRATNCLIEGNDIWALNVAVYVDGANFTVIGGGKALSNNSYAVGFHDSYFCSIRNVDISSVGGTGVDITDSSYLQMTANMIRNVGNRPVYEGGSSDYNLCVGNSFLGFATAHNVDAANDVVEHNLVVQSPS